MDKYLSIITKVFQPKNMTMLGRWKPEYSESIVKNKIYWANNDHCGPCGIQLTPKGSDKNDLGIKMREKNE